MSAVTASISGNGPLRHYFPFPGGLYRSAEADQHYANIRRNDLIVAVRRLPPRSLPPRDMARAYNTELENRLQYHSLAGAQDARTLGTRFERPENTRRKPLDAITRRLGDGDLGASA